MGRANTEANYRLRIAVEKARANSMPADTIKRAIERATGAGGDAEQYEEITYEGLGRRTRRRDRGDHDRQQEPNRGGGARHLHTGGWVVRPGLVAVQNIEACCRCR